MLRASESTGTPSTSKMSMSDDDFTKANEKINQELYYLVGSWYVTTS